ncbi:MAG: hypothetical protein ACXW0Q_03395 [Methylovulum sp.]
MKNSYFLVIPKQQDEPQRLKLFGAKALEQWIAELPIANMELSARLMDDFIMSLNAIKMPVQLRLDALELLRPSLLIIEDYLRKELTKTGFPKGDNDKNILRLLVALEKGFTISYWMVLKELTEHEIGWFKGQNAALSLQRSIKGLSSIVISYFIMGMSIPDWVWMDLHSLYKLSVKIKKDTAKVANDTGHYNKTSSPKECYLQILLLSLAEPTGLMQKEILLVYHFIESIFPLLDLKSQPVPDQLMDCIILVDEDRSPFCQQPDVDVNFDSAILYIDFTKLYQAFEQKKVPVSEINARFNAINAAKNIVQKPSAELLEYLKQRWSGIDLQSAPLFNDRLDRYITIGLTSTFSLQKPMAKNDESDLEVFAQSSSDRLLSCVFNKTGVLSVGSLVSFRKQGSPENQRLLGIVDKLVVGKEDGKINFGLQLLANRFTAVNYLPINAGSGEPPRNALFYNNIDNEMRSYIIVDTFVLKEDDAIRLFFNQERVTIALKNKKNIGLGYWRFECKKMAERRK